MLEFKMIENTETTVSYRYYPHRTQDSGLLTVNKKDNSIMEQQVANSDEFKTCFFHLFRKIKDMIKDNDFLNEGIIAWY